MKDNLEINKQKLGIDSWLKLIGEDKNLNGAYISIAQYIWLLEQQYKKQKEVIDKVICYVQENTRWELRTSELLDILKER